MTNDLNAVPEVDVHFVNGRTLPGKILQEDEQWFILVDFEHTYVIPWSAILYVRGPLPPEKAAK